MTTSSVQGEATFPAAGVSGGVPCLLVHVPKLLEHSPELSWYARVNFVAMGVLSIAEALAAGGYETRIIHVGVEKLCDPAYSLCADVERSGARLVGFSLHWHPQIFDSVDAARQLKNEREDVHVVMGGLTASYFGAQLLAEYPWIDSVVCGEGERPMVELARAVLSDRRDFSAVPNLVWRDAAGAIRDNGISFLSAGAEMDRYRFASLERIGHLSTYLRLNWRHPWEAELRPVAELPEPTLYGAAFGRGCLGTCTWCSGSFAPMKRNTGRTKTAWRSAAAVSDTVTRARELGVERFYFCFDPDPRAKHALVELFQHLGRLRPQVKVDFELFDLPSPQTIAAFHEHLDPSSTLIISPETADEKLRRRHRAFSFTNDDLDRALEDLDTRRMRVELYFTIGLPGEDRASILATARYQRQLREAHLSVFRVATFPLEIEPGAPWYEHPERYGLTLRRRSLSDFLLAHCAASFSLGYDTDCLQENEILELHQELFSPGSWRDRERLARHWRRRSSDLSYVRDHRGPTAAPRSPSNDCDH
ncbi:MAG: cobalamin B12-binding domain-containing protein [Candidatus Schekmanbacteria bacterium]|nr:cobalamin B12-binding domain-containing protein [Candidatus Schekmanbacteria bacterium]